MLAIFQGRGLILEAYKSYIVRLQYPLELLVVCC